MSFVDQDWLHWGPFSSKKWDDLWTDERDCRGESHCGKGGDLSEKIIKINISNSGLPPLSQWAILRFTNSLFQFSWCGQWWRWQWSLALQGLPWLLPPFPSHRWELAPFYFAELFREIFLMNVNIIHCPNWSWENLLLLNHGWLLRQSTFWAISRSISPSPPAFSPPSF